MDVAVMAFPTDRALEPAVLAGSVEERGLPALFFSEHTHIPVSMSTPHRSGGPMPDPHLRTYDIFVALAMAAAATTELVLGTGICQVAQRDAIVTAKEVASLDRLSHGRLVFGVGYGWNVEEMRNHGVDPAQRHAIVREKVLAMQRLWTQDEASFEGEFVRFTPSWMWPKPVQQPFPPLLIGGPANERTFRAVIEYADGWMPIGVPGLDHHLREMQQRWADAGRDPAALHLMVCEQHDDPALLEHYAAIGVQRVGLGIPEDPRDCLTRLDALAGINASFMGGS